jgi:hypothetical protein
MGGSRYKVGPGQPPEGWPRAQFTVEVLIDEWFSLIFAEGLTFILGIFKVILQGRFHFFLFIWVWYKVSSTLV